MGFYKELGLICAARSIGLTNIAPADPDELGDWPLTKLADLLAERMHKEGSALHRST